MANLDDLNYTSITDMSNDEALELLRQIRLSRRTPNKSTKQLTKKSTKQKSEVSPDQAAELLRILTGGG